MFAQRVASNGVVQWTADGVALCIQPEAQEQPSIATDDVGGAIVAWMDFRNNGSQSDIYAQRVTANGHIVGVPLSVAGRRLRLATSPNPSHGPLSVALDTPVDGSVSVRVIDAAGRVVRILSESPSMPAGHHEFPWDGSNIGGKRVGPGIYSVVVRANGETAAIRIALLP
jgi:hypothetical protein